jgi:pyridoxamine--pyruvate transaminase
VVSVVHCETPCGTVNDLDAISAVVAGHGALLIVDAVSTFGGIRCDFTAWQADVVVTAPQKCLGGPPGLSLLHVSEAAWAHMAANPAAPRGSVLSILDWRGAHLAGRPFPFTPSVTDVYGLHACLEQYLHEGAEAVRSRHRAAARAARAGAEALGLTLWAPDPAVRSDTITAVRVPAGIDEREVRAHARAQSGVMLSGGQPGPDLTPGPDSPAPDGPAPDGPVCGPARSGSGWVRCRSCVRPVWSTGTSRREAGPPSTWGAA